MSELPQASRSLPQLRLRVTAAAESAVRAGHPWVFSDSVREMNRAGRTGELAVIYDRKDRFLALGFFDAESPIRVRVLHAGKPAHLDATWWRARLRTALERRRGLFDERTTGFRWIHGESDGWPGLVLDRYAETLVLKVYAAAWWPRLGEVAGWIAQELRPERIVVRSSRNACEAGQRAGVEDGAVAEFPAAGQGTDGEAPSAAPPLQFTPAALPPVLFLESGLRFEADVVRGQKTGFFLDQRENRRRVEALAAGREVLNLFSFSGGFSLYAARGGARSVTDVDISAHALAAARRNFALNAAESSVACCAHATEQGDAFAWLEANEGRQFDLVILDPPSLAKREVERAGAIEAYERLAGAGLKILRAGGVLVAASCSAHVSEEEFFSAVLRAAGRSGRRLTELERTGHPADHPAGFAEARYLKCIFLKV